MNFNDTKINNTNGFAIDYAFSDFSECQFCKKTVSKGFKLQVCKDKIF